MQSNFQNIILFDGECILCQKIVQFIIKNDPNGKFKFSTLKSEIGAELLKLFGLNSEKLNTLVFIQKDKYFLKSSATLHVLKVLGGFWKIFYAFIFVPKFLRDFIYDIMAKSRYNLFGKSETCLLPTPDIMQRFL